MERAVLTVVFILMVLATLFFSFMAAADYRGQTWPFAMVASACAVGLGLAGRGDGR